MWALLPFASSPEHCLPRIQFLFIGSRLCSTLLSDLTSRFGPCASLSLHLHLVVKRTYTSQLSDMLGTPTKRPEENSSGLNILIALNYAFSASIASVNSTSVSTNTRPRIIAARIGPAAPGLRAMPSQAADAMRP